MSYLDPVADFIATIKKHYPYFADEIQAMVIHLHNQGRFSEGYAATILKQERIFIRELAQAPARVTPARRVNACPSCGEMNLRIMGRRDDDAEFPLIRAWTRYQCTTCPHEWTAHYEIEAPEV